MLSHALRAARVQRRLSIAFRSSASNVTTSLLTAPSDIVAGDLLIWYNNVANTSGFPTAVTPTGFTLITNGTAGTNRRLITAYKVAVGGDASSTITGMSAGATNAKAILVFSTNGASSASVFDIEYQATDGDPTAQTITSATGTPPLVDIGFVRNLSNNRSMTPTQDGELSIGNGHFGLYKIYNSSPVDVVVDTNDGGNANTINSFYMQVS